MVSAVAPTTRSRQTHLHALSHRRVLNSLRRMLITLLTLSTIMAGQTRADEQETSWNVMAPPGPWRDISIDTTTTTWSFLDVSPDGREIVFDMLGDIYTVPIEGGDATPLTQGIEWNFQPAYSPDGGSIMPALFILKSAILWFCIVLFIQIISNICKSIISLSGAKS